MSFWDVVWFIFISFAFVAYLMVMFSIIGDIFRDRSISGPAKGAWVVALIFFPLVTALVYLFTRGDGMAERAAGTAGGAMRSRDDHIRQGAVQPSPTEQIAQARAMRDAGDISQAEFDTLKQKALV
jgi:hypothetical protein